MAEECQERGGGKRNEVNYVKLDTVLGKRQVRVEKCMRYVTESGIACQQVTQYWWCYDAKGALCVVKSQMEI